MLIDHDEENTNIEFNVNNLKNSVNLPHRLRMAWIDIGDKSLLTIDPKERGYFAEWDSEDGNPELLVKVMREAGFKWMPEIVGAEVKKREK